MIDKLEALERAATPGPWTVDDSVAGLGYDIDQLECGIRKMLDRKADAEFIAAARNALPALLRVARAAKGLTSVERGTVDEFTVLNELWRAIADLEAP